VEAEVGFETSSLSIGDVLASKGLVQVTTLDLGKDTTVQIGEITTSSPLVKARLIEGIDTTISSAQRKLEITIAPGLTAGLLSEKVTVRFKDDVRPASILYLYGIVVNDIEVMPLALAFVVSDSVPRQGNPSRSIRVTNKRQDPPVEVLGANDPGGLFTLTVVEKQRGQQYDVIATLGKVELAPGAVLSGNVVITTNHPGQSEIKIPYRIERK